MNEYIKTDVGEYLTNRIGNFEKSPPDELWKHIENNIPKYSKFATNRTLIKYLISGISLSVVIIVFIMIYYQPFSYIENNSTTTLVKNYVPAQNNVSLKTNNHILQETNNTIKTTIVSIDSISQKIIPTPIKNINKKNHSINESTNKVDHTVTYSINASGLKNVDAISFINEINETVLVSKNPVPNSFGFYVIDISQLAKGSYNVMVTTPKGIKLHKREHFK